jgi:hypothetical protein
MAYNQRKLHVYKKDFSLSSSSKTVSTKPMFAHSVKTKVLWYHHHSKSFAQVAEFCPTLRLVYFIALPPLAHYSAFIVFLATTLSKKVGPQVKNSVLRFLRTCKCLKFLKSGLVISASSSLCPRWLLSQIIWGLLLHSVTISVELQRGIYSILLPLSREHQLRKVFVLGLGLER